MDHDQICQALHASGMRFTSQRLKILQILEASDKPLNVDEIRRLLSQGASGVPTIYRNLELFVKEGWAEGLVGPGQVKQFIRCHSQRHHHHLQCERCGRMVEVDDCHLDEVIGRMANQVPGFQITRHQLLLFGLCQGCQT